MSVLRAAGSIGSVTLLSRILGLYRDILMLRMFDWSWALGTFTLAWMVPNLLRRLFGEGALAASFIPAYAKARAEGGEPQARRLLASILGMLLLGLGSLVLLTLLVTQLIPAELIGRAGDGVDAATQGGLMLQLSGILFPYALPICVAAILAGVLNTHGSFALPAASPVVLNLFWIAGIYLCSAQGIEEPSKALTLIAACLLCGGLAQVCLSLVPLLRRGLLPAPSWPRRDAPGVEVLRSMGPTVLGMSLVQVNTLCDQGLAWWLIGAEAPSYIYYANRLLLFPHALTSLALATALFPRLAEFAAAGRLAELRRLLDKAIQHTWIIALPAALGLMLVAEALLGQMAGDQSSGAAELQRATWTTVCLAASLPFLGIAQLQARALFSLGDFKGPAWMSFWLLLLNLLLNLVFVLGFDLGVAGLALATSVAAVANTLGLRWRLQQRLPRQPADHRLLARCLLAAAAMAGTVWACQQWQLVRDPDWAPLCNELALPVLVGMLSYGGLMYLFGLRRLRMES